MRNKGFFWFLTILLAVVSIYQLSFTGVSNSIEKKAEKEADFRVADLISSVDKNGKIAQLPNGTEVDITTTEGRELAKSAFINQILKEKANEKVYPVIGSTFQEVKSRSLALGLDLVGGMSVTLEISIPELVKSYARNERDLKFKKPYDKAVYNYQNKGGNFIDLFASAFKEVNGSDARIIDVLAYSEIEELNNNSSNSDVVSFLKTKVKNSMDGVEKIMSKRINQFGVAEPNLQKDEANNRLYIELPGVQDEATVSERLQSTANLQFFETYTLQDIQGQLASASSISTAPEIIQDENDTTEIDASKFKSIKGINDFLTPGGEVQIGFANAENKEKLNKIFNREDVKAEFPGDLRFMWSSEMEKVATSKEGDLMYTLYAVRVPDNGKALVGGKDVKSATATVDQNYGTIIVNVSMTDDGADRWYQMTSANNGKYVAITMDNTVFSAPRVNEPISGGNTQISGNFTKAEAESLSGLLNGGSLPAPCVIKEQTKVGPTIGNENASAGIVSFVIAFCAIFVYMFFYYGKAGLVANIALIANVLFIFGCLASFGAVLTLAGIAGIVLTIGTAVDANILIFERIRDEQRHGLPLSEAVQRGFSRALPPIIDANVTHLLVAIILKIFGTGPIESFATTLIVGIFTSVFSAIVITKLIITGMVAKDKAVSFHTKLSANLFQNFHFDWVGKRKYFYIFSIVITIAGLGALFTRGLNPSVEFSGGRSFTVKFNTDINIEDVRSNLKQVFVENGEAASVELKTKGSSRTVDIITNYKLSNEKAQAEVVDKLKEGLDNYKKGSYEVMESRTISASVSSELIKSSTIAIVLSIIVIFAFIFIRFGQWQYSVGTIISLIHDVLVVLSVFALLHGYMPFSMDVDQAFIAAILTVISYSVNDTVIVFDRVRENLATDHNPDHKLVVNNALNSTLSRTINTSMTLFVVVLIMFLLGSASIKGFLFAMLIGVVIGTYSSLCVGTPILVDLNKKFFGTKGN